MNVQGGQSEQQRAARRKLVRGVFALPAVMTVVSGNAVAAQSSLRCLRNQVGAQVTGTPVVQTGVDSWVRVQLYLSSNGSYYVRGADLVGRNGGSVFLNQGQWQQVDVGSGATVGFATTEQPPGMSASDKYVVVRFNATGDLVGIGAAQTGSANVTGSCWASFGVVPG